MPTTLKVSRRQRFGVLLIALVVFASAAAQQPSSEVVCVQSWKTGGTQIMERVFHVSVGPAQSGYETTIPDLSGRRMYKLILQHNELQLLAREHWKLELFEASSQSGSASSENLIAFERPGPGGDNFPREDLVG